MSPRALPGPLGVLRPTERVLSDRPRPGDAPCSIPALSREFGLLPALLAVGSGRDAVLAGKDAPGPCVGNPFLYGHRKRGLGERHSFGFGASLGGLFAAAFLCPSPPPGADAGAVRRCFSRLHSLGHCWIPVCSLPPPPSLPPPAGCHPPSGSRAVQLSCDFAWARNVGPQLFWSRVGVVLSLARHPTTPLTAACLKEVGILCSSCRMCHCRTCHRADGTRACVSRSGFCLFSCVRCCMGREKPEPLQTEGEGGGDHIQEELKFLCPP